MESLHAFGSIERLHVLDELLPLPPFAFKQDIEVDYNSIVHWISMPPPLDVDLLVDKPESASTTESNNEKDLSKDDDPSRDGTNSSSQRQRQLLLRYLPLHPHLPTSKHISISSKRSISRITITSKSTGEIQTLSTSLQLFSQTRRYLHAFLRLAKTKFSLGNQQEHRRSPDRRKCFDRFASHCSSW